MKNYRPAHSYTSPAVAILTCLGLLSVNAQTTSTALAAAKKPCAGLHCTLVKIDHVSKIGSNDSGDLKYVLAIGKAGTYILSCIFCEAPIEGQEYEYSEQPLSDADDDHYAFLSGPHLNHAQYEVEVIVPDLPLSEVKNLIGQCQSSDRFSSEVDCGKWVARKLAVLRTTCPDPEASTACKSFQELVGANDPYVMDDLAHQDHVYACFVPGKDEFFEVTFSEPNWFGFKPPTAEQVKDGVPSEALTIIGGSEFSYYRNGVGAEDKGLHNIGNWIYFPLGEKTDPQSMRKNATSKRTQFKGKNIEIVGDRWTLSETYKNQAGTETEHTVTLQLATGRFKESFTLAGSGKDLSEISGRCLIVPSNYY